MAEGYQGSNDICENEISDDEISRLAYQVIPDEVRRFAVQFLKVSDLDFRHAKAAPQANSWDVAFKCIDMWKKNYCGINMRGDLCEILEDASREGLISLQAFQFLKEDHSKKHMPLQVLIQPRPNHDAILLRNQHLQPPLIILNQIANALCLQNMDNVAVDIFGFPKRQLKAQKRLAEQQVMFSCLCSWWQFQPGPAQAKAGKLLERLESAHDKGLIARPILNEFKELLSEGPVKQFDPEPMEDTIGTQSHLEASSEWSDQDEEASSEWSDQDEEASLIPSESDLNKQIEDKPSRLRTILSSVLTFIQRIPCFWKIWKLERRGYQRVNTEDYMEEYDFDVFVSYCHQDVEYHRLPPYLEGECGLRMCFHQRDFQPGNTISANIVDSISTSHKVILVISENYFKSAWCREECDIALQEALKRKSEQFIILAVFPNTDISQAPEYLRRFLHCYTYIEVKNEWALKRIARAIGQPLVNLKKIVEL